MEEGMTHKHPHSMIHDLQEALAEIAKRTQWHPNNITSARAINNWVTNYAMRWVGEIEKWFQEDERKQ